MNQPPLRKHNLWKHQLAAYGFANSRPATLVGAGMGTGKSFVAVALSDNWEAKRVLVLCPTTVRPVWRREIARHAARDYDACILDGGSVRERTDLAAAAYRGSRPCWVVINYEAAWREPFRSWARSVQWDVTILDESHRVQRESRTAKMCNSLRPNSERRLCLTGTPLTQDPSSIWAQCRFLDPAVFTHNLGWFERRYTCPYSLNIYKILGRANLPIVKAGLEPVRLPGEPLTGILHTEEYLEKLSRIAIRIENEVLDLPPLAVEERTFRLSPSAQGLYDAIEGGHKDRIETGRWPVLRESYATTMRLQQITSGWLPGPDGKPDVVDTGKADCLRDILTDAGGEPVVVFGRFVNDLGIIQQTAEELGLRYGEISARRKDGIDRFAQMPDGLQVVGVQEQAGGAGIDLSRARLMVDYSPSWSLTNYEQKIARVCRPPQSKNMVLYRLVCSGTIDEEIALALQARRGVIKHVWRGLEGSATVAN